MADNRKTCEPAPSGQAGSEQKRRQEWNRLAAEYLRDLPRQLDRMRKRLQAKDYSTIKGEAHRIKGTSGTYRFEHISKSAARLEQFAASRDSDAIASATDELMRLIELETKKLESQQLGSASDAEGDSDG